jgi:aryl-alcohol dehydrogenase-like predicted oxidoreductase
MPERTDASHSSRTFTAPTSVRDPRGPSPDAARATPAGTSRYRERFAPLLSPQFFRHFAGDLTVGSIGIGTYLGEPTTLEDELYAQAVRDAIGSGINLIDTAINYRCQRSERVIGRVLRSAIESGLVRRDELVVATKGGFIPLDTTPPMTKEGYQGYLRREFYARGVMTPAEVVAGGHCISPDYLRHQLARSLSNLGVSTVDIYYVHSPEQQLTSIDYDELMSRMREAFAALEQRADAGDIAQYGCATWHGFRTPPGKRGHIGMADLVRVAREVAGEGHRFRVVQMPVSLAMPEALRAATQPLGGDHLVPALEAATELGLSVVASAPLMQGKLTAGLPPQIADLYPGHPTDAARALAFVRSLPLASALVGMKHRQHVAANLGI